MIKNSLQLVKQYVKRIQEDDLSAWAAKLTFFILLSIFPFLIFLMEILSQLTFKYSSNLVQLSTFFPSEVFGVFELIVSDISSANTSATVLPLSILFTVWSSSKGIMVLMGGLNMAYKKDENRNSLYLRAISILYTIIFALIILVMLGGVVFGGKIIDLLIVYVPGFIKVSFTIRLLRILISIFITFLFFLVVYNATPHRRFTIKHILPGAIFSTVCWLFVSYFFSFYVNAFNGLSYLYGSLTGIIILLLWLYISSIIILLGAEINAMRSERLEAKIAKP